MKKLLSLLLTSALVLATVPSFANDDALVVTVDNRLIYFDDQQPVEQDGRVLVPIRGVFSAMGCDIDYNDETQTAVVYNAKYTKRVDVTVGSNIMTKYVFTSVIGADKSEITLDVPAVEMNDRILVPLRAIAEAFDCDVAWDDASHTAAIDEKIEVAENTPTIYAVADKKDYKVGDTITYTVYGKNLAQENPELKLTSITLSVDYDDENMEYTGITYLPDADESYRSMHVENPDYTSFHMLKAVTLISDYSVPAEGDLKLAEITFKTKGEGGLYLALTNLYHTRLGDSNLISFSDATLKTNVKYSTIGTLVVDTTQADIMVTE